MRICSGCWKPPGRAEHWLIYDIPEFSTGASAYFETAGAFVCIVWKFSAAQKKLAGIVIGYDTVMPEADAISRSKSTDRQKIRDAIANTHRFEGIFATISLL
jgi:hypothetical protein